MGVALRRYKKAYSEVATQLLQGVAHVSWPSCLKTPCPGLEQGDTHQRLHLLESVRFQLLSMSLALSLSLQTSSHLPEDQGDEASIGERPGPDSSPLYLLEVFCGLLDDMER